MDGEPTAWVTLVEQYQPAAFRVAMSILDHPERALAASREAFLAVLAQVHTGGDEIDFPTLLVYQVVENCRHWLDRRRRQRKWRSFRLGLAQIRAASLPVAWRGLRALPIQGQPADLWEAFIQLAELDRLALILRYDHHLSPVEISLALGERENRLRARLYQVRQRLLRFWVGWEPAQAGHPVRPVSLDAHEEVHRLIQAASDHQIMDKEAARLKEHLKACPGCQEYQRQFTAFEEGLSGLFQHCWDEPGANTECYGPQARAADFARALQGSFRRKRKSGHKVSLSGALILMLIFLVALFELPSWMSLQPISALPRTAAPLAPTNAPSLLAASSLPLSNPDLLRSIYPGKIVYVTPRVKGDDLFIMRPDGSQAFNLTIGYPINSSPAWSPDGSQIAYLSTPDGRTPNQVWVVNANGTNRLRVSPDLKPVDTNHRTDDPADVYSDYPSYGPPRWSPDGQSLVVVVRSARRSASLALIPLSGQPVLYLPVDAPDPYLIQWSPDGSAIAYVDHRELGIWLWQPGAPVKPGGNPRLVSDYGNWDQIFGLSWSPDAREIAILAGDRADNLMTITLRNYQADSGALNWAVPLFVGNLDMGLYMTSLLSWSPDGRYLAFIPVFSNDDLRFRRLMLIDADGSSPRILAEPQEGVNDFSWSGDGRWIAFSVGSDIWAASLHAYELGQTYLVKITSKAGSYLSWQAIQ